MRNARLDEAQAGIKIAGEEISINERVLKIPNDLSTPNHLNGTI